MPSRVPLIAAAALIGSSIASAPSAVAAARPNSPATRPTSGPTTQPAGPKDVLKQLASAMRRGEAAEIRGVLYAANETEQRMARATADYAAALAALQRAAVAAFGEHGAKELTGDAPPGEEIARIDAATLAIDGDTATVTFVPDKPPAEANAQPTNSKGEPDPPPPPPEPVVLKRVGGRWRVPVATLSKGAAPEEIEQRLADLSAQTALIQEIAQEIAAGKYKSAEQAGQAWRLKVYALTPKPGGAPTTQPSTKPTRPENPPPAPVKKD